MSTRYPSGIDDNTTLPQVIDLVTPVRAEVPNNNRGAILAVESELGVDPSREYGTVRARLDALQAKIDRLIANSVLGAVNVGTGAGVYRNEVSDILNFRSLTGINGITAAVNGPEVDINGLNLLPRDGTRAMTGALDMGTNGITDVVDPVDPQDAATKHYVDGYIDLHNEWSEVLAIGATSGGTNPIISTGDQLQGEDGSDLTLYSSSGGNIVLDAGGDGTDGYVVVKSGGNEIVRFDDLGSPRMLFPDGDSAHIEFDTAATIGRDLYVSAQGGTAGNGGTLYLSAGDKGSGEGSEDGYGVFRIGSEQEIFLKAGTLDFQTTGIRIKYLDEYMFDYDPDDDKLVIGHETLLTNGTLYRTATGGNHEFEINGTETLIVGNDGEPYLDIGTNTVATGAIRLPNNTKIVSEIAAGGTDLDLAQTNASDQTIFGDAQSSSIILLGQTAFYVSLPSDVFKVTPTQTTLYSNTEFNSSVSDPILNHESTSGPGDTFTIQAQTSTNDAGGHLVLSGGNAGSSSDDGGNVTIVSGSRLGGLAEDGYVIIERGSTEVARWNLDNQLDVAANRIIDVQDPVNAQDAATKNYVDGYIDLNNEWSEVLAIGNTSGGTNPVISTGDVLQGESDLNLESASDGYTIISSGSTEIVRFGIGSLLMQFGDSDDAIINFPIAAAGVAGVDLSISAQQAAVTGSGANAGSLNLLGGNGWGAPGTLCGSVNISGGSALGGSGSYGGDVNITGGIGGGSASPPGSINLTSGYSGGSISGDIALLTGLGGGGRDSGTISITTGYAVGGSSGDISLVTTGGVGTTNTGSIGLTVGDCVLGTAGSITVTAGTGTNTAGAGDVSIASGSSVALGGGDITISPGTGTSGGTLYLSGGAGTVSGGHISMNAGDGTGAATAGNATVTAGNSGSGDGGYASLTGGLSSTGAGGNAYITGGVGAVNDGYVIISRGVTEVARWDNNNNLDVAANRIVDLADPIDPQDAATKNYVDGYFSDNNEWSEILTNGATSGGTNPIISTGDSLLGETDLNILGGDVTAGADAAGYVSVVAGDNTGTGTGGYINIEGGDSSSASSAGNTTLTAGNCSSTGSGGSLELNAGNSVGGWPGSVSSAAGDGALGGGSLNFGAGEATVSGTGGNANFIAGDGISDGGDVNITAGTASAGPGADVILSSGVGSTYDGYIVLKHGTTEIVRFGEGSSLMQFATGVDALIEIDISTGAFDGNDLIIKGGSAPYGGGGSPGDLVLRPGDNGVPAGNGSIKIEHLNDRAPDEWLKTATFDRGSLTFGDLASPATEIILGVDTATGNKAGLDLNIYAGAGGGIGARDGGDLLLSSGAGADTGDGGDVDITGGAPGGTSGSSGGSVNITAPAGNGSGGLPGSIILNVGGDEIASFVEEGLKIENQSLPSVPADSGIIGVVGGVLYYTGSESSAMLSPIVGTTTSIPTGAAYTEIQETAAALTVKNTSRRVVFDIDHNEDLDGYATGTGSVEVMVGWLNDDTQIIQSVITGTSDSGATPSITGFLVTGVGWQVTLNADTTVALDILQDGSEERSAISRYWFREIVTQVVP